SLLAPTVVTFSSDAARADTSCAKDADCVKGFIGQTSQLEACPDIACAPNEACDPPPCTSTSVSECVPGPCTADGNCAAGMACIAQAVNCATPAAPPCAAGQTCPPGPAVDAGACGSPVKQCIPRYDLPCQASADCGEGFPCLADTECGCAGSAGTGSSPTPSTSPSAGGTPDQPASAADAGTTSTTPSPAPSPMCSCTTLATSHCSVNVIQCTTASDCPAQWSCLQPPTAVSGCAVSDTADGSTTCTPIAPPPVQSVCEPPYLNVGSDQGFGSETSGSGSAPPLASGGPSGAGSNTGAGGSTAGPENTAGCQMGPGPADVSVAGWAGLFGLAAFARRRSRAR